MNGSAEHPNVQRLQDLAHGFNDASSMSMWHREAVWHVAGASQVAGTYRGMRAIMGYLGRVGELTGGSLRMAELLDALADDEHGVVVFLATATRGDTELDVTLASALRFDAEGLLKESWFLAGDQRAYDYFFN